MYNFKFSAHSFKGLDCGIRNANSKQSPIHFNDMQRKMSSGVSKNPLLQNQTGPCFSTKPKTNLIKEVKTGGKSSQTMADNRGCSPYHNTRPLDQAGMAKEPIYTFREVRTEGISSSSKDRTYLFKEVKTPSHSSLTNPRNTVPVYLSKKGRLASYAQLPSSRNELSAYPKSRLTPRWTSLSKSKGDILYEFRGVKSTSDCASMRTKERVYTFKETKNSTQSSVATVRVNANQSKHLHKTNTNVPYIQYFPTEFNTTLIAKEPDLNEFLPTNDLPTRTKNVVDTAENSVVNVEENKSSTIECTKHLNDDLITINETVSQSDSQEGGSEQVVACETLTEPSLLSTNQVSNLQEVTALSRLDHGKSKKVFRDHFIDGILDCNSTLTTQRELQLDSGEIIREKREHNSSKPSKNISEIASFSYEPYSHKASLITKTTERELKFSSGEMPEIAIIGEKKAHNSSKPSMNDISETSSLSYEPYSYKSSLITKTTEKELKLGSEEMAEISIIGEKKSHNSSKPSINDISKMESFSYEPHSHEASLITMTEHTQPEDKLNSDICGLNKQKAKESLIKFQINSVKLEDSSPKSLLHCLEKPVVSSVPAIPVTPVKTTPKELCPAMVILKRSPVLEKYVAERRQNPYMPYQTKLIESLNQTQSTDFQQSLSAKEELGFFIKRDELEFKTEPSTLENEETLVRKSPALMFDVFGRVVVKEEPVYPPPALQDWEYLEEDSSFSFEGFDDASTPPPDLNLSILFGSYSEVPSETEPEPRPPQGKGKAPRKMRPKPKKPKATAPKPLSVKTSKMPRQRGAKRGPAKRSDPPKNRPVAIKTKLPSCCKSPQKQDGKKRVTSLSSGKKSQLTSKKDPRVPLSDSTRNSVPEKTKKKRIPKSIPSSEDSKSKAKITHAKKPKTTRGKKGKPGPQGKKPPSNLSSTLALDPPADTQDFFSQPLMSLECQICLKTYRLRKHLERHLKDHQNAMRPVSKPSPARLDSIGQVSLSRKSIKRSTMGKSKGREGNVDTILLSRSKKKNEDDLVQEQIPPLKNEQGKDDLIEKSTKSSQAGIFGNQRELPSKRIEKLSVSTTESAKNDRRPVSSTNLDGHGEAKGCHDSSMLGDPDQLSKIKIDEIEPDNSNTECNDFFSDFIQDIDDSEFIFTACGVVQPKESVRGVASPIPLEDKKVSRSSFAQQGETVDRDTCKNSLFESVLNPGEKTKELNPKIFSLVTDAQSRQTKQWQNEDLNQIENNSGVNSTKIAFSQVIPTLPIKIATNTNLSPLLENSPTDSRNLVQQAEVLLHDRVPDCLQPGLSPSRAFTNNDKVTHEGFPVISSVCHQTNSPFYSDDENESDLELQLDSDHSSPASELKELDGEHRDLELASIVKDPSGHNILSMKPKENITQTPRQVEDLVHSTSMISIEKLEAFTVSLVETKDFEDHQTPPLKMEHYGPELALVCHPGQNCKLDTLSTSLSQSNVQSEMISLSPIYTTCGQMLISPQPHPVVDTSKQLICVAEVVNVPSTNSGLPASSQPVDIFVSPAPPNIPVLTEMESVGELQGSQKYKPIPTRDHKTSCLSNSQDTTSNSSPKVFQVRNITQTLLPQTDHNSEMKPACDNQGCSKMALKAKRLPLNPVAASRLVQPEPSETKNDASACNLKSKNSLPRGEEKSAAEILKYNTVQVLLKRLSKR